MAKQKQKIYYYTDELTDDFAGKSKKTVTVDGKYTYVKKNFLWRALAFLAYRVVMTPFAWIYCKIKFRLKIVGREKLKASKKEGLFVYGNHTLLAGDAFLPSLIAFPHKTYVIVHADNVSTKGAKNFVQMCGAIPIPTERSGMKNFLSAIEQRRAEGGAVHIYPEAHIWPYYIKIRSFPSTSLRYPVKFGGAVYTATTTFQKKKIGKTPRVCVYVDGPFYPDKSLSPKEQETKLRDTMYEIMVQRSQNSTYLAVEYRRAENTKEKERE